MNPKLKIYGIVGLTLVLTNCGNRTDKSPVKDSPETTQSIKLSELIRAKEIPLIKDSDVIKRIALDSFSMPTISTTTTSSVRTFSNIKIQQAANGIMIDESKKSAIFLNIDKAYKKALDQLAAVKARIVDGRVSFRPGLTSKSYTPITSITGERPLTQQDKLVLAKMKDKAPARAISFLSFNGRSLDPAASKLDLRDFGIIGHVQDQGESGDCWAFSTTGAYETSYMIQKSRRIKAAEQYVLNCSGAGSSNGGGLAYLVFKWMVDGPTNMEDSAKLFYSGMDKSCSYPPPATDYFAMDWDFVDPARDPDKIPSVAQIKKAICRYGAITASVFATDDWRSYGPDAGPFRDAATYTGTNHSIQIIGWDESIKCWLIKNSWGTDWGSLCNENGSANTERGYMWIDYSSENIGKRAAWVKARK